MKYLYSVVLLALTASILYAQNTLSGKITNLQNQPLPGATISITELNKGTTADANGNYELRNIPVGQFQTQVSYIGYQTQVRLINTNSKNNGNFIMIEAMLEAPEVVISGVFNATQHQNATKIDVLKLEPLQIEHSPNFMKTLTKVPGVDMISKGSGVSKPVIRGLSMNDVLVLNNGVRFENYQYSNHHPLGIDEFGLQNVEIIKGPASLLYGSDAIGGVINFIKENPASVGTLQGDFHSQYNTNTLGYTNNLGLKGAGEKIFGGIRIGQKSNADFKQGGGEYAPNTRFNEKSLKANVGFSDKFGTFKLFYDYNNQKLGLAEEHAIEDITRRDRKNEIFYQELNTHLISSQNRLYLGRYRLDVNGAYQNTTLAHLGEPNECGLEMQLETFTYDAKLRFPATQKTEYITGFQGFYQKNTNINDRKIILLPDATTTNYSLFGLMQYTFFEKMRLQAGLRYDMKNIDSQSVGVASATDYRPALDKSYDSFSGSVGVTFNWTEELLLRANFAAAYRTPNLAELTSNGRHEERYEVGDAALVPEKSYEADLSMHYHTENLTFDIAGFYNMINDYIFIAPTGTKTTGGVSIFKYKQANAKLYGMEAGVHYHPQAIRWLHLQTTFASVTGKHRKGREYLPFIPAHKLRFEVKAEKERLGFLHNAFVSLDTETAFAQKNAAPNEESTDAYTLLNANVGGKVKIKNQEVLLSISATNIFDKKYRDHLSTLREVDLYNPGRNISLNLSIPFSFN